MRLGVLILPETSWPDNARRWRAVEDLGFDSAWTYDHLWWRSLSDGDWYSSVPVLSAAAAVTTRMAIGVMVASPNLRHPVVMAKDAVTINDIAGGRFVLGVGAGSAGAGDAMVVDREPLTAAQRADRFAEYVRLTDQLLHAPVSSHSGRFYAVTDAHMRPCSPPSLAVAASGRRGTALAARYGDAWITMGPTDWSRDYRPDECLSVVTEQTQMLRRACDRVDRSFDDLDRIFVTTAWAGDPLRSASDCLALAEAYAKAGITHLVVHWPRESGVYAGDPSVLHDIAADVLPVVHEL
nr:LLM class flavin-dependent oxidoreductase [Kibdelosporangium sp. MJ126-NF4]CEL13016.1 Coenzyme F420-dependent N5,N10-methylene tetrahydromethanopterin reductase and related flavin-dependent oxidoreductases [Kibdelosporangium sp. MJ126-NF4]CTQ98702.1 Coenzyme F420-dependent N5,N10-methylene tetrahydromethanopterin reductase and related flavin-dependent oxidoreductases [Kibdelosporangium sp. MJ126-NF4]